MKPKSEYQNLVLNCAERGKALARTMANNGVFEPLYLYCRPSQPNQPGELLLVRDSESAPHGYQLVTGEGLRGNISYESYFTWVFDRAKRTPILSLEVAA
jgi:hypothetical protein